MKRAFTRTEVEQYFMEQWAATYVKPGGEDTLEIKDVGILNDLPIPIWVLEISVYYRATSYTGHSQFYFYQEMHEGKPRLRICSAVPIPAGYGTVREELAEEVKRDRESRARVEAQLEARRQQREGK